MLLSCCERLTDFFISQCGLPETRRSWYIYTLQTRISMFLSTAGMMLLGCLVATPYQVICFLVGILSLRRRLGGYHAKTPLRCLFLSIGVSILCLSMLMSKTTLLSLNWITLLLPILLHTEFNFIAIPNSRNTFIAADGNHMSLRGIIPWPLLHANGEQSFLTRQPKRFVGVQFTIVVSVRKHITGSMKPAFTTNFTVM